VLNGVGGRTVAEAQARMTWPEFVSWRAYRRKRGSLNVGMRVEAGFGMLAALYANLKSKHKYSRYDFMDHDSGPPVSLEKAMEDWK
jgi:hypothetical protein